MSQETIKELLKRQPFEPFALHLTNGEKHPVRHPEQVALGRSRLALVYPETDRMVICALLHIASIEMLQTA